MSGWIGAWGTTATVTNLIVTGSEVISVNTSTDALRITQTGAGNALVVEDSVNPDSTPFTIDKDGKVFIGGLSGITARGNINYLQVQGVAYSQSSATINRFNSGSAGGPGFEFNRSRNGSLGGNTVVLSNDTLGEVYFNGADGTGFIPAASITAAVDGTPGTNDMPGRLVFNTTVDGASSPTPKMTIDNAGNVYGTTGTTGMTNGFFHIPAAGGAPSGVPTTIAGRVPMYYDTTNNNFYVYNGAWKKVLLG